MPADVEFVATDPWLHVPTASSAVRKQAYTCLNQPLNFIATTAEFLPFTADSFDWVHMRSMLDHVQVVDLALLEARRVLHVGGKVLIGLYVDGGKTGVIPITRRIKDLIKAGLEAVGINRWKDHHVWHPTYAALIQLNKDNGFEIDMKSKKPTGSPTGTTLSAMSAHASQHKAMIIPRIFGGLGNQLFCYAAARRLALVNNAELVIDDVSGFVRDHTYQRQYQLDHFMILSRKATPAERLEPLPRVRRYLKRAMNRRHPFQERSYIQQEGVDFDPRLLTVKPRGTLYLEGNWQSEQYFKDVEPAIREELRIIPPKDEINQAMAERICGCQAVAVHVRFFDAPQEEGVNNAPGDYYARAVVSMESLAPDAHYFVFSDQPAAARDRIPLPEDRITLVSHNQGDENAYADLWLMTQCRHFIIANSTFSWWGAWLAESAGKLVIAPGFEVIGIDRVTSWGFKGLLPCSWIKS